MSNPKESRAPLSWSPNHEVSHVGITLDTFILEGMFRFPDARGTFTSLLNQITLASKLITRSVRRAGLNNILGETGSTNVQGEDVQKLDVMANETMINSLRRQGHCAALASEELDDPVFFENATGNYLVVTDPLDGSSNIDVNISIGTIFGVCRMDEQRKARREDFLKKGTELCAAGYVIYGSSTVLVLTTGEGVHGFTWDPTAGEYFLSHENIRIPERGSIYSVNEGNLDRWTDGVKAWAAHMKAKDPSEGRPYTHRYVGSMVADVHRTLLRGGVFAYPADKKNPEGKLRLLYEAAPMSMIIEAAGGRASTGKRRILDIEPDDLHMRVPLVLGSPADVETFERFVAEDG